MLADLPAELQRLVVASALDGSVAELCMSEAAFVPTGSSAGRRALRALVRDAGAMACACRDFADVLGDSHPAWAELVSECFGRAIPSSDLGRAAAQVREGAISARRAAMLVGYLGCEACGAPRVRKVHWPIAVRCCAPCFARRTISKFALWKVYGISCGQLSQPYTRGEALTPIGKRYDVRFYWTDAVLPVLRDFHCLPSDACLSDIADHVRRRRKEEAKAASLAAIRARWAAQHAPASRETAEAAADAD